MNYFLKTKRGKRDDEKYMQEGDSKREREREREVSGEVGKQNQKKNTVMEKRSEIERVVYNSRRGLDIVT